MFKVSYHVHIYRLSGDHLLTNVHVHVRFDRKHIKPQFSQTILLPNVYNNPGHTPEGQNMSAEELQADFDRFYEDFFM